MSLAKFSVLLTAAFALFCLGAAQGNAAVVTLDSKPKCETDCSAVIKDWLSAEQLEWFPLLGEKAERFDAQDADGKCDARPTAEPVVHAIVLAPFYDHFVKLPGTQNDAALWRDLFQNRGVRPENLHVLAGNAVTRQSIIDVMRGVARCVRERDQVVLTFSGGATSYRKWGARDAGTFFGRKCEEEDIAADLRRKICTDTDYATLTTGFDTLVKQFDELVLFSSEVTISGHSGILTQLGEGTLVTGLRASELSNFAIQVRNRGADAFFILDTNYTEDSRLLDQQQQAGFDAWRWERGDPLETGSDGLELFGSGEMAALYAARSDETAYETKKTGGVVLGELTFAVSEALRSHPRPTIEQLAREVDRTMAGQASRQVPVFEATNPGLRFLAPRDEPQSHPERIEMINPKLTRSAIAIKEPELDVVARYDGPGPAAFASIDGVNVETDANGQFRRRVKLDSRTEVPIRVYGRDASLLAERRLLFGEDEVEASLAPVGRRLALIIANTNYDDPAFPTLGTPLADGKALQKTLADKFGFVTTLKLSSGEERDLFLEDATSVDIKKVLSELRKSLTAEDQLLVFYAGHGQIDAEKKAYWVPVDGKSGDDWTWIEAHDITEGLRKLASGAVLLISDSCYAGGLSRSGSPEAEEGTRDRYLAKATRYKARQLIASGGDEPVQDGGGGGHSLFARALLEALEEMPEKIFTANELFDAKVKPKAIEYAFAASAEGQTPVFYRMTQAGDEPESEFIFVAK